MFEAVKDAVTAREAAEYYGIEVKKDGKARCPFHDDHTPSLKLDRRYHCFGCGADGDVVNFVADLFEISNYEAAMKIAEDFRVSYEKGGKDGTVSAKKKRKKCESQIQKVRKVRFEETERNFYRILSDYYHLLKRWKEERAPKKPNEEWDAYFCEALENMTFVEHVMDTFLEAGLEEKIDIITDYGKKVKQFERRIEQYRSEEAEEVGQGDGPIRRNKGGFDS